MERRCVVCGVKIPKGRLKLLPATATCTEHSQEQPKTEFDVEIDGTDPAELKQVAAMPKGER